MHTVQLTVSLRVSATWGSRISGAAPGCEKARIRSALRRRRAPLSLIRRPLASSSFDKDQDPRVGWREQGWREGRGGGRSGTRSRVTSLPWSIAFPFPLQVASLWKIKAGPGSSIRLWEGGPGPYSTSHHEGRGIEDSSSAWENLRLQRWPGAPGHNLAFVGGAQRGYWRPLHLLRQSPGSSSPSFLSSKLRGTPITCVSLRREGPGQAPWNARGRRLAKSVPPRLELLCDPHFKSQRER